MCIREIRFGRTNSLYGFDAYTRELVYVLWTVGGKLYPRPVESSSPLVEGARRALFGA